MKLLGAIRKPKDLVHKEYVDGTVGTRQMKLAGDKSQLVGFNENGEAIPVDEISEIDVLKIWNGGN